MQRKGLGPEMEHFRLAAATPDTLDHTVEHMSVQKTCLELEARHTQVKTLSDRM